MKCKITTKYHNRSDDTLLMKVRGPNYHVGYLRQKKQTQHKWKANEKWTLAVYNVQEFQMKKKEIDNWEVDKEVELPLTAPKKEVEVNTIVVTSPTCMASISKTTNFSINRQLVILHCKYTASMLTAKSLLLSRQPWDFPTKDSYAWSKVALAALLFGEWFCMSRTGLHGEVGGGGGGGGVHPLGEESIAVFGLGCRNALVGTG